MATRGWLDFDLDSADSSILFRHDLKTPLVQADSNGNWTDIQVGSSALSFDPVDTNVHGHVPTHDSVKGMKAVSSSDGSTECGYRFNGYVASLASLINEGQISFEIESQWLCDHNPTNDSNAYQTGGELQSCFNWYASAAPSGGQTTNKTYKYTADYVIFWWFSNNADGIEYDWSTDSGHIPTTAQRKAIIHSLGKSEFSRVSIGWKGNYVWLAINEVIVNYYVRPSEGWTQAFRIIDLGHDNGVANRFVDGHYMRNLIISNKAPRFDLNYSARQISVLSDSMFTSGLPNSARTGDMAQRFRIFKAFEEKGQRANVFVSQNSGHHVDSGEVATLHDYVTTVLDKKPNICVLHGGTNDSANSLAKATFETEYKSLVEKLLGENGNVSTATKLICVVPPARNDDDGTYNTFLTQYRDVILSIPAWFETTYGATKKVYVVDAWELTGGENTYSNIQYDDVHYAALGHKIVGDAVAETILSNL